MIIPNTPRIYVACLAAYNEGYLHGTWIDASQDPEAIQDEINHMLKTSPANRFQPAEEWAIHDFESFYEIRLHEYESLETVSTIAQAIEHYGEAFAHYYEDGCSVEGFEEAYLGEYNSEEDFVYSQYEESRQLQQIETTGLQSYYINWEAIARDWFINDYVSYRLECNRVAIFLR